MIIASQKKKPLRIISIEDDEFMKIFLKDIFWLHKHEDEFVVFSNLKKARQYLSDPKNKTDLLFLDLRLPEEDGGPLGVEGSFQLLKDLKTNPKTKDIKVIIFSSFGDKEIQDRAIKLGAEKFLIKGENMPHDILKIINELFPEGARSK